MSPKSKKRKKSKSKRAQSRRGSTIEATAAAAYVRPRWHKIIGIGVVATATVVLLVNFVAELGVDVMPGGHQQLYFITAIAAGAVGAWLMGAFDKPAR